MKKIIKICAGASALVAGCGMFATKPVINTANAISTIPSGEIVNVANTQGDFTFKAINLPKTVNAENNDIFFIPNPTVSEATGYTIKINVKEGKNLYSHVVDGEVSAPFVAATNGVNFNYYRNTTYDVYYTAEKDGKIFSSSIYNVNVEGVKYSYDISDISTVIPSVAGVNDKILLPTLTVLDANGDVVKDGDQNPIVVTPVVEKDAETVVENAADGALKIEDGKYYLYAKELGTYTISYKTANYTVTPQTIDIDVESTFNSSKIELDVETLSVSSVDLNVEKTLPTAKVHDIFHNIDNIAHTTVISILDEDGDLVATLDENTYKYTFTSTGTYKIEYKITTKYLNVDKTITKYINNVVVSDRTAPEVFLVKDYDTTVEGWEDDIEVLGDYAIPSRVGWGKITLPAIYGKDAGTAYDGLTLTRVVIDTDGKEHKVEGNVYESAEYTFASDATGTYTIEYRAVDGSGRTTPLTFKVEVLSSETLSYTEDTNLEISLPTINNDIYSDQVKTVKVNEPTDDKDKSIETRYYFYYGEANTFNDAVEAYRPTQTETAYGFDVFYNSFSKDANTMYELNCEDNKLEIALQNFSNNSTAKKFTVVAVAINDQGQFATATEEVGIKQSSEDSVEPTMTLDGEFESSYTLGEVEFVSLPIATFSDKNDAGTVGTKALTISAKYYIDNIENGLLEFSCSYIGENGLTGFVPVTKAGVYYVVYTATDDANNSYDFVTSFRVDKKTSYSIHVDPIGSIDVFGTTEINAYVYDEDKNKVDVPVTIKFTGSNTPKKSGTEYTFNSAGIYTFIATAKVGNETIESGVITVNVKDLSYAWEDEKAVKASVAGTSVLGETVKVNVPLYTYGSRTLPANVKVLDPNGEEVELTDVIVDGVKTDVTFVASLEGKYTIEFSSENGKLNESVYTYVGDYNKPSVIISNKDSIPTEITYNEKDITLTLKANTAQLVEETATYNVYKVTVTAKADDKEIYSRDINVKLFDINGTGAQVALKWEDAIKNSSIQLNGKSSESSSSFKWTINSTGDYELSIIATDTNARESKAETISFKVVEKSGEAHKKDNKAGIILIVVAIVLLAGIVSFFAFAGKSPKSKKVKPVKVEEKKEDEKDNQ